MTPQLQQAIKLLQLSRIELMETVQNELLENPFLEEGVEDRAADVPIDSVEVPEVLHDDMRSIAGVQDTGSEKDLVRSADWEDYLGDFASTSKQSQPRDTEAHEDVMSFEARLSNTPSLAGHLAWQLRLSRFSPQQMTIGEVIIGNLDSVGYLQATLEEVAEAAEASPDEVLVVLEAIQRFDPVGVACRTPKECLLTQIKVLGYDRDPILVELVREHLEDLEKKRYKPLARKFRITMEDIKEYLDVIQSLDPMPGASFRQRRAAVRESGCLGVQIQ